MDLTGQTLLGKYEIENLLGMGGMGAVWRARHALTGRKLAIKVLDESYLKNRQVTERFEREARAASAIQHPGIVEVLDIDQTDDGIPFMVMEFLEGETLASRIERRGRLDEEELVRLGVMLLEALDAAHAQGVIHRDLKPENIYVCPAGRRGEIVKILDFGISHMSEGTENKLTMTGSVLGTPHYMSPEQAMGENVIDHRADIYACGVVLYECAVGDVPYDAPNYNKLLRLILDEDPPPPRERGAEISEEVERVILWAMDKTRDRRIGSAREMIDWLQRAAAGESVPYEPRPSSQPPQPAVSQAPAARPAPLAAPPSSTHTPRPAGGLPANQGVRSSLADVPAWRPADLAPPPSGEVDVSFDAPDEESGAWHVSPTLMQRAAEEQMRQSLGPPAPSTPPPPGIDLGSIDLDDPLTPAASPARLAPLSLELDERALRGPTSPPPRMPSMAPATGNASTSGAYKSIAPGSGANPAAAPTRAGTGSNPHIPRTVPSGVHSVPPRLSELSGRYDAQPPPPEEPPAWRRYALFGLLAVVLFVGLVFGVRMLVQPGVDDSAIDGVTQPPPPDREPGPDPRTHDWVSITVSGLPPGAHMNLDGLPATSPFRVRTGSHHTLELTAPGYEDRSIEFDADSNRTLPARLRPAVGTGRTTN